MTARLSFKFIKLTNHMISLNELNIGVADNNKNRIFSAYFATFIRDTPTCLSSLLLCTSSIIIRRLLKIFLILRISILRISSGDSSISTSSFNEFEMKLAS